MNKYINYKAIKKSVEKLKNTSVSGSPYLAYLLNTYAPCCFAK